MVEVEAAEAEAIAEMYSKAGVPATVIGKVGISILSPPTFDTHPS